MTRGREETERIYAKLQGNHNLIQKFLDIESGSTAPSTEEAAPTSTTSSSSDVEFEEGDNPKPIPFMYEEEDFGRIDDRPIGPLMEAYCVGDVTLLHAMHQHFVEHPSWNESWADFCRVETERRLVESKEEGLLQERLRRRLQSGPEGWCMLGKEGEMAGEKMGDEGRLTSESPEV